MQLIEIIRVKADRNIRIKKCENLIFFRRRFSLLNSMVEVIAAALERKAQFHHYNLVKCLSIGVFLSKNIQIKNR